METIKIKENDKIFSTGVYLKPEKVVFNGIEQWRWIAVGFEDDSYLDGNLINVYEYSDKIENLVASEN
jgi:hypothetical protein